MNLNAQRDLSIQGKGTASGGTYDTVKVQGHGTVTGNLECVRFTCHGSMTVRGGVRAEQSQIHGASNITGNLHSKTIRVQGHAYVDGSVSGEHVSVEGALTVGGDCQSEVFSAYGRCDIGGLLNAGVVDIRLHHASSHVKDVGGERIQVRRRGRVLGFLRSVHLTADTIEGDDIYLEFTRAKVVRGSNVDLGPGCHIERVEYKSNFKQDKSSIVDASHQI